MQEKCDSLVQTDISIMMTPQQEDSALSDSTAVQSSNPTPRPSSLPGLISGPDKLTCLAGKAVMDSPKAPTNVKAFARSLVQGLITDTIGEASKGPTAGVEDASAASMATATAAPASGRATASPPYTTDASQSSLVEMETDSLDDHSPKKVQQK